MIGTSPVELLFIRFCILGLHYLAPICILYVIFVIGVYGVGAARYPVPLVIECVALAETLFYLFCYLPYSFYLQHEATHPPAPSKSERRELFNLCNQNIPDIEAYLQKWFLGAQLDDIKRDNMKEFFLWAFFNRDGGPGEDDKELEQYITTTEQLLGRKFQPGRGKAKSLRTTIDRVGMMHRSLIWYFCVGFVDFLTYLRLLKLGFHFHRSPLSKLFTLFPFRPITLTTRYKSPVEHLTYWHRPHTSKTRLPVLFIHGIGIGLYPYTNFFSDLNSRLPEGLESDDPEDQVGIIAIEIMPISFRITHPALSKDAMCTEIASILAFHSYTRVVLVSHSFGTVVSTHLLQHPSTSSSIGPLVLIDPVSILLHLPDVAYNFTRRLPQRANEHQLYYFASMDMAVSHTLARHFFWNENVVWQKDLQGRNVTISLGEKDLIVNTEAVGRYLVGSRTPQNDHELDADSGPDSDSSTVLVDIDDESEMQLKIHSNAATVTSAAIDETEEAEALLGVVEQAEAWKRAPWTGKGVDVIWFEGLDHAQAFDKAATRRPLVRAIRTYCAEEGRIEMAGNGMD